MGCLKMYGPKSSEENTNKSILIKSEHALCRKSAFYKTFLKNQSNWSGNLHILYQNGSNTQNQLIEIVLVHFKYIPS